MFGFNFIVKNFMQSFTCIYRIKDVLQAFCFGFFFIICNNSKIIEVEKAYVKHPKFITGANYSHIISNVTSKLVILNLTMSFLSQI